MAGQQPARSGAGESINDFMARRRRELADRALGPRVAHEADGASVVGHRSNPGAPQSKPATGHVGHPGFAESLIPVWGSAREAVADYQDGDYAGAALNGALAASDLFLAGSLGKAVAKGGLYAITGAIGRPAEEAVWKEFVRPKMGELGMLDDGQHGHHWFFPQRNEDIPAVIRNHPWNIKAMPSHEVHGRVHHRFKSKPRYGLLGRYWHGTPAWSKAATGSALGHPVATVEARARHQ